jgi:hypothetical protein
MRQINYEYPATVYEDGSVSIGKRMLEEYMEHAGLSELPEKLYVCEKARWLYVSKGPGTPGQEWRPLKISWFRGKYPRLQVKTRKFRPGTYMVSISESGIVLEKFSVVEPPTERTSTTRPPRKPWKRPVEEQIVEEQIEKKPVEERAMGLLEDLILKAIDSNKDPSEVCPDPAVLQQALTNLVRKKSPNNDTPKQRTTPKKRKRQNRAKRKRHASPADPFHVQISIDNALEQGPRSVPGLAFVTGWTVSQIRRVLPIMEAEGQVKRLGKGSGTKWMSASLDEKVLGVKKALGIE